MNEADAKNFQEMYEECTALLKLLYPQDMPDGLIAQHSILMAHVDAQPPEVRRRLLQTFQEIINIALRKGV